MTWMPGTRRLSKLTGSTGHHPPLSITPAAPATAPARCGGITFTTSAFAVPPPALMLIAAGSTPMTAPPLDSGTRSSRPGYSPAQACSNSACPLNRSLASSTSTLLRGLLPLRYHATRLARSYGPDGLRYGSAGTLITTVPPSGIARSCSRSRIVCSPGFQACGIRTVAAWS